MMTSDIIDVFFLQDAAVLELAEWQLNEVKLSKASLLEYVAVDASKVAILSLKLSVCPGKWVVER